MYLSINRSIDLSIYRSIYLSIYLSVRLSVCLSIYLSIYLFANLKTKLFCETSSIFVATSKTQKFSETPNFLHLTTSKTKQICETSSILELDNIKNEAILRDILQKWKVECRADGLVPIRFAIFPRHLSKLLRLPRKRDARSYEVLHLSRKIISANLKI